MAAWCFCKGSSRCNSCLFLRLIQCGLEQASSLFSSSCERRVIFIHPLIKFFESYGWEMAARGLAVNYLLGRAVQEMKFSIPVFQHLLWYQIRMKCQNIVKAQEVSLSTEIGHFSPAWYKWNVSFPSINGLFRFKLLVVKFTRNARFLWKKCWFSTKAFVLLGKKRLLIKTFQHFFAVGEAAFPYQCSHTWQFIPVFNYYDIMAYLKYSKQSNMFWRPIWGLKSCSILCNKGIYGNAIESGCWPSRQTLWLINGFIFVPWY